MEMRRRSEVNLQSVLDRFRALSDPDAVRKMTKVGITPDRAFGVPLPEIRALAKEIGKDHDLALELWRAGYRETRILACMVEDPKSLPEEQMEEWASEFDYWEICDQCCMNLFEKTPFAIEKAVEWSGRDEEFVKRAGFVLMARMAVGKKKVSDEQLESFFPLIEREATDGRNNVKKAVNWALRQIGKRNRRLNRRAIETAERLLKIDSKSTRWIARDALRELKSDAVQARLKKKEP